MRSSDMCRKENPHLSKRYKKRIEAGGSQRGGQSNSG